MCTWAQPARAGVLDEMNEWISPRRIRFAIYTTYVSTPTILDRLTGSEPKLGYDPAQQTNLSWGRNGKEKKRISGTGKSN
jgi:hypothetical protein